MKLFQHDDLKIRYKGRGAEGDDSKSRFFQIIIYR